MTVDLEYKYEPPGAATHIGDARHLSLKRGFDTIVKTYSDMRINMTPERFFKAVSDTTRLNSLLLLRREGRLCVCELVHALEFSQPKISRHLGQLRDQGIVQDERCGQWVHYSLSEELPDWALDTLDALLKSRDLEALTGRLDRMVNRPSLVTE